MKRDVYLLKLSLRFAKEYLIELDKMQLNIEKVQESKKLSMLHRALWTSLIIEIGKLFDNLSDKNKQVIYFKEIKKIKKEVDKLHGQVIIQKIINTRNTFTGHFSRKNNSVLSASNICNSNLKSILNELDSLPIV